MPENALHQPNHRLLKAPLSSPDNTSASFANHLPAKSRRSPRVQLPRPRTVHPDRAQFTASKSDLLFRIKLRPYDACLYLLVERQNSEAPRMALRLPSYIRRRCAPYKTSRKFNTMSTEPSPIRAEPE